MIKMKMCSKIGCIKIGIHIMSNGSSYCNKCYRFTTMRYGAKATNQYVPSFEELNNLFLRLEDDMLCPNCGIQMVWKSQQNNVSRTMSLQHNNDNTIQFLCHSCNIAHGHSKLGDQFLEISNDHKYCAKCSQILSKIQFYKDKTKKDGLSDKCKTCYRVFYKKRLESGDCVKCGKNKPSIKKSCCDLCLEKLRVNRLKKHRKVVV